MRHKNSHRKFGRDFKHVKALMRYVFHIKIIRHLSELMILNKLCLEI